MKYNIPSGIQKQQEANPHLFYSPIFGKKDGQGRISLTMEVRRCTPPHG